MIINPTQAAASFQEQSVQPGVPSNGGFMEIFAAANQISSQVGGNTRQKEPLVTGRSSTSAPKRAHQELQDYLNDYLRKGPIQRLREVILKKMGLTEDKLQALPPEQRAAVEEEIAEKIKEYLLTHKSNQQQSDNYFAG